MEAGRRCRLASVLLLTCCMFPLCAWPQSFNGSIRGTVVDPSGAAVPQATITLRALDTGVTSTTVSGPDGLYAFPNIVPSVYEIRAAAKGFEDHIHTGIRVNMNESLRVDISLQIGSAVQSVEVSASASPLNYDNGEIKEALTPKTIEDLPLLVAGNQRSAASFVILMPGVTTGGGSNPFDARINGGIQSGDEAVLDGVTMQEGLMSQSGMIAMFTDFPVSPDSVSEISVLTANYEPQYGSTTSAVITAVTKSGTTSFHGEGFEFLRNTVLNSRQFGVPSRPNDLENEFGGNLGGPVKIPGLAWTARRKTYFFVNYERYYIRGGLVAPVLSIPSLKERNGDFSDWVDSSGNLIPVYDPATTRANPSFNPNAPAGPNNLPFLRDQFMGCNGTTPNVICPSDPRLQNSLATQWLKYLPTPTFGGPLNNYVTHPFSTLGGGAIDHKDGTDVRVDEYLGDKDHVAVVIRHNVPVYTMLSALPAALATEPTAFSRAWMNRLNLDHTFSSNLLNNFNYGFSGLGGSQGCVDQSYANKLPQITGVEDHIAPPVLYFQNFNSFGCNYVSIPYRLTNDVNDLMTWVKSKHTFKFGGGYRRLELNQVNHINTSGTFNFSQLNSGLLGVNSGNAIASFLLGDVSSANATFYTVNSSYARSDVLNLFWGDTYKATRNLSITYGLRWDMARPSYEKYAHLSFFDPVGPNPGANNLPGRLAFAGNNYGPASFGASHPENTYYHAFAPRLGLAYSLNPSTVVRAGYGIFYDQAFYPGWNGGMALDGFNATPSFSSSDGGITPAMVLTQGFPQNFTHPPFINSAFLNGEPVPSYRPFDGNRLPYSQQWNLTVERHFTNDFYASATYLGTKGSRLPSLDDPLNTLDPRYLSMGQALYDQFQPGQTSLDGVSIPYAGWVDQMTGCPPTVAQALLKYPQYCGAIQPLNDVAGKSIYHSFQLKAEKRASHGLWVLASYTVSKLLTDSEQVDESAAGSFPPGGVVGVISPYQRSRDKALSVEDVPQLLSLAVNYQLPIGRGRRFLNVGGPVDKVLGGWELSTIFRASAGTPLYFRSSQCNVPPQFNVGCIPGLLPGANPFAHSKSGFDPSQPLLNAAAFESASSFNFYFGQGPRVSNFRGFGYHNQDVGLIKNTHLTERVGLQFRAEFFNVWNWHILSCQDACFGTLAFTPDVSSPAFGMWDGAVTPPRNIQFGMKLVF